MIEHQADLGHTMRARLEGAGWTHVSRTSLPVCCVTHPRIEAGELTVDEVLARVLARGRVWISKVTLAGRSALRACVTSRLATPEDIDVLVEELENGLARGL
ncbi:MAG: hypothetical protein P8170_19180 [Gemmatimonadota bacterium]